MANLQSAKYQAVVGLEIHAELSTKTKMFCRCQNDPFHAAPNSHICPVCLGLPGALPVINRQAVESAVMVGLAMDCQIACLTKWDRKNYFYPDLPKGYQISQSDLPLCRGGQITLSDGQTVHLTRIHLEEDTGTLQHPAEADYSLVNYNRSGVPLLELVTEPDIRSGQEARLFAQEYQRILRSLGAGKADMEKGEMRVEANVSIRTAEEAKNGQFRTKVEVKNLNSFRSVQKAIEFEIDRQIDLVEKGETVVQETRGWHDAKQITFSQRIKEGSADYRYFPEPDLAPLELDEAWLGGLTAARPALPAETRAKYIVAGLTPADAETLVNNRPLADYLEAVVGSNQVIPLKLAANWVINEASDRRVEATNLRRLLELVASDKISTKIAKDVLVEMRQTGLTADQIIEEKQLKTVDDPVVLNEIVETVLSAHPAELARYRAGQTQLFGFFLGAAMRQAKGQANPQGLNEALRKALM